MQKTLLSAGVVCLMGAVLGGGLKALGFELPLLSSVGRQVLLGGLGVVLLVLAFFTDGDIDFSLPYLGERRRNTAMRRLAIGAGLLSGVLVLALGIVSDSPRSFDDPWPYVLVSVGVGLFVFLIFSVICWVLKGFLD
ncbi:MAG: hypothetical protein WBS19_15995 [Candidatus Korobacteraceae bacterium]